ncbi:MAG: leucine-rich repeat protein [Clostridia bacterium]|nr:leucine-rich repeat protein [Clostridia bacterium]
MQRLLDFLSESPNPFLRALFWVITIVLLLLCVAVIGIAIFVVGIVIWAFVTSNTTVNGDFTYFDHKDYITLSNYNGTETAIVLPAEIDGVPVTSITYMIDKSGLVEDVTIPDELALAASEEDMNVFCIDFPALQNYHVSADHPTLMTIDGVLYSKDGKTLLAYPVGRTGEAVIPEGVEVIWFGAFRNSAASSVVLPQSLRTISSYSMCDFRVMRLLTIPQGVTEIDENAFTNTNTNSMKLQLIVTQDSPAHSWALEYDFPIREVLPATQDPAQAPAA